MLTEDLDWTAKKRRSRISRFRRLSTCLAATALALAGAEAAVFNVADYGAAGGDPGEDTVAITAAIEAAAAAGGGEVFFPAGTYVVSPPGSAVIEVYRKTKGQWIQLEDKGAADGWSFGEAPPPSAGQPAGSFYLNRRNGKVYRNSPDGWKPDGDLVGGTGSGWRAGHELPPSGSGEEGILFLRFHVAFDHQNGAVFELQTRHNNIRFRGEGPGKSILSFRTWANNDPMDYGVDTRSRRVLRSAIPPDENGRFKRGSLFVMRQTSDERKAGTAFDNIHWEGLQMRGNTTANGKNGWYTPYQDLEEWDISNKCIVFTFGARPMTNISVRNCSVNGWRGEILYKGGANPCEVLIEDCDIFETNSSAVSISGNLVMRNCRIWNTYNGVENYCDEGQFTEIEDCLIDLDRDVQGAFGVVYLGTSGAYLTVRNSTITGAKKAAVFLSDFAHNVDITGNRITDCRWGLYVFYQNLYDLPGGFHGLRLRGNTFTAESRDMEFAVLNAARGVPGKDWILEGNRTVQNGARVRVFFKENNTGPRSRQNVVVRRNELAGTRLFDGDGIVPVFSANEAAPREVNTFTAEKGVYALDAANPHIQLVFLKEDGLDIRIESLGRYPVGHRFTLEVRDPDTRRGLEITPGSWNNLRRPIRVESGDLLIFEFARDGRFHLVPNEQEQGGAAPPEAPSSYWEGVLPGRDGFKETEIGLICDAAFPWIYHPLSRAWIFIDEERSTISNLMGTVFPASGKPFPIWTSLFAGGWYYRFNHSGGFWSLW